MARMRMPWTRLERRSMRFGGKLTQRDSTRVTSRPCRGRDGNGGATSTELLQEALGKRGQQQTGCQARRLEGFEIALLKVAEDDMSINHCVQLTINQAILGTLIQSAWEDVLYFPLGSCTN